MKHSHSNMTSPLNFKMSHPPLAAPLPVLAPSPTSPNSCQYMSVTKSTPLLRSEFEGNSGVLGEQGRARGTRRNTLELEQKVHG